MVSVSKPNPALVEIILSVSGNYFKCVSLIMHRQTWRHATESWKMLPKIIHKWLCNVQLSPRGQKWPKFIPQPESSKYRVKRFGSYILIRIRFPLLSNFWISVSGWKLTILPDIQQADRLVITSDAKHPELSESLKLFQTCNAWAVTAV